MLRIGPCLNEMVISKKVLYNHYIIGYDTKFLTLLKTPVLVVLLTSFVTCLLFESYL